MKKSPLLARATLIAVLSLFTAVGNAGPITSTFVDLHDGTFSDLKKIDDGMGYFADMGIRTVLIAAMALKPVSAKTIPERCNEDTWVPVGGSWPDMRARVEKFLAAAKARKMKVVLGVGLTMTACPSFHSYVDNRKHAVKMNSDLVAYAESHWKKDFDATLVGYYLPDEVSIAGEDYHEYTAAQVQAIQALSRRPIYISPYLGNTSHQEVTPDIVGALAQKFIQKTGVQVLLYQDSVGASAMNMGSLKEKYTLEDYFSALARHVGKAAFQPIVEIFNYGNPGSTSIMRLNMQAWQGRFGDGLSTWIAQGQMYPENVFGAHPGAPRLHAEYMALYQKRGHLLDYTYQYAITPHDSYPDTARTKLKDTHPGNPLNPADGKWVGVWGNTTLNLDLGAAHNTTVDYVSAHALSLQGWSIYYPEAIYVASSVNGRDWSPWKITPIETVNDTKTFTLAKSDGEYVLSNSTPLGLKGRYLRVYFPNARGFTFLSELTATSLQ